MSARLPKIVDALMKRRRSGDLAWQWGVAAVTFALATGARAALTPLIGHQLPFVTFYPAVAVTAMMCGGRAGLGATAASALIVAWLFTEPPGSFRIVESSDLLGLSVFTLSGLVISTMAAMVSQEERRARASDERFRAMVNASSDAVYEMSADWREMRLLTNRQFITETSEPTRTWLEKYILPEDQPHVMGVIDNAIKTKTMFQLEHRVRRPDGSIGWAFSRALPLLDASGNVVAWFGAASDITARKQAEEALRDSEERFRTLADSIPNLAWWGNADGYITWFNQRWYEYTGTTPREMEGWGWQAVHDPEVLPAVLERWKAAIALSQPFEMELPLRGANGSFRWFLTRSIPVRDGSGQVQKWFGTTTDITDLREARMVLTRGNEELEKLVAERTAQLRGLVGELEHFSYTITHDMRAPLRAMRGFAEVALHAAEDKPNPALKMALDRIMVAAERMDGLIIDALNYSRIVRTELPLGPVDVGKLLRGMLSTYPEFQAAEGNVKVDSNLPLVIGNEAALTQCFSNLLTNALKFTRDGVQAEVRVTGERRGEWVRLWVEDNGAGIPPTLLPKIFQMFSHGGGPKSGTGIGLALVRKVVDRMGGHVGVESEQGKGSRFWVELKSADLKPAA